MTITRLTCLVLALLTALAAPAAGMEIYVHVQDETTTDPIEAAYVRYIFNPGTAVADTADGYTDIDGNVHLTHALVSGVPNTPSLAISRPYPNPAGSTATFEVSGGEKAAGSLSFALYDLRGRRVGDGEIGAGAIVLSRPLASGSYLYRVKEGSAVRITGKLAVLGRLERVEFKAGADSPSSKAGADPVDILVQGVGYEDHVDSQVLQDGNHFQTISLTPESGSPTNLSIKVFNISGSECLLDGAVTLSQGAYSQTESAGPDSLFNFTIPAIVDSVEFAVSGFLGHDHPNQVFSVLDPDSVAVRGWLGDEESMTAVGGLPLAVYLELVPEQRLNDASFLESAAKNGVSHRIEDVRFSLQRNTVNSYYQTPANEATLGTLRAAREGYLAVLDGGNADGINLIGYSSVEIAGTDGSDPIGRHDFYVDETIPPGHFVNDVDDDGDIEYSRMNINNSSTQAEARSEIGKTILLYENEVSGNLEGIGDSQYYTDIVHTVMKSRIGRLFGEVTPQPRELLVKVFDISGSECLLDGSVTLSDGTYSETALAGADSLYFFNIPAWVTDVQFSVDGFVGYEGTIGFDSPTYVFSVLNPDSVAVRGWLGDDESNTSTVDLPPVVFLELIPADRLNNWDFMESSGLNGDHLLIHRTEDVEFTLFTLMGPDFLVPADAHVLDAFRSEIDLYTNTLAGGFLDQVPLIGYTVVESSDPPPQITGPEDLWMLQGKHYIYQHSSIPVGVSASDFEQDGDIDWASSFVDIASTYACREELINATVLFDNEPTGSLNHISGDDYYTDIIHTVLKSKYRRQVSSYTASTKTVRLEFFDISGSTRLTDGRVRITGSYFGGNYNYAPPLGGAGTITFRIPTVVDSVSVSVWGFSGYDHANQLFSILHPDSVAVRGWLGDQDTPVSLDDLPPVVYVELVPEARLNDPYFIESSGLAGTHMLTHRREDVRFVLRTFSAESGYTEPADEVSLNKLRSARDNYLAILDGGAADGIPLIQYTSTEVPVTDGSSLIGRHDMFVDDNVGPGNSKIDADADGDIDYATSHINNSSSQGHAREEIANPTVLYDNEPAGIVVNLYDDLYYRDIVHTVMKSRIGLR